jgi:DNA-binding Lrp family transcriptional regulator
LTNVSARTIKKRIDNLTKNEIIKIRSVVNPDTVGYTLLADIFIEVKPGELSNVAKLIAELPQVSYVACATGDTDIIISVRARDLTELYTFVMDVIGNIPGVQDTQTYPLPLNIKSILTWMPPGINEKE